ncbi:MAG: fumarylacetoacetate hydrolase family protein [Proteobacteria bacterium]|nr:fumarylacetoacetate hydrolase family protein [Pseudomonadota bacterium]
MTRWVRFRKGDAVGFGTLDGTSIAVHAGDMFAHPQATGDTYALDDVALLMPCTPGKVLGMWRNYRALNHKNGVSDPVDPLYFIKANTSLADPGTTIRPPTGFSGTVIFEGELGVVLGKQATAVDPDAAEACIFGYTCVNDVTATEPLQDTVFPHWTRAKGFDTFGPLGPCIRTDLDWRAAHVRVLLDGVERQNYPLADMVMSPATLVSRLSWDMTLMPGDVIAVGTSVGVGRLKPGCTVSVEIDGIGALTNRYG